ncbi:MAG: RNA polymerase sigma factor RpoE [Gammaproteobacteria bacterium]|nr:RNA polymerase sigma factor RpoE [Gammaproteobacteria bacterium]MDE0279882.1 RNA polymerase sigma factor RpoE [Gammaproteobacteria bacterium]MXX16596.1 RNA polymerase sigma factor RpoE [Gammaproteobacteria bacterium]MXY65105.1 RNA polymerase sigma factor RpoE [Gammaproteobacteria bacterium]MYG68242.1 RNA polymerase sigma factor RpoE [Gammaproteobacteria bacterium]
MDTDINDSAVVERVRAGDKQAFNLLVARYQYKIQNLVARLIRDPAEQEDVAQEAFIKAYRAIGNFRGDSTFYTWLYRIAINTAKNHLVGAGRKPPARDVDVDDSTMLGQVEGLVEMNSPEAILQNDELVNTIRQAIAELPDELREAIMLREFDGLSYEDIADVMGCPIGTVRSRIFRARDAIEQAMGLPLK